MEAQIFSPSTICPSRVLPMGAAKNAHIQPLGRSWLPWWGHGMAQDPAIPWATDLRHSIHIIIRRTAHYYPSIFKDINSAITINNRDLAQNK